MADLIIRRGFSYQPSFTLYQSNGTTPTPDLDDFTIKFCVNNRQEHVFDTSLAVNVVSVNLTPGQTATIEPGRGKMYLKLTIGGTETIRGYYPVTIV